MNVLVTGASGFIARALIEQLQKNHSVFSMGRKNPDATGVPWVRGNFADFEDLKKLDAYDIDSVVHLAAVTGGCSEKDGMLVNVEGTRCLMRYLLDRGCRKFVLASSIAAIGIQHISSRPLKLPVPDNHPCFDSEGYGFSKFMMEKVTEYYARQCSDADIINLRLCSIAGADSIGEPRVVTELGQWAMGAVTLMLLADAVSAFEAALTAPASTGVRTMNAAPSEPWLAVPTAQVLQHWWGDDVDLSWYAEPANQWKGIFDVSAIQQEIGFTAERTLAKLHGLSPR